MRRNWPTTIIALVFGGIAAAITVATWSSGPGWGTAVAGFFAFGLIVMGIIGVWEAHCPRCQSRVRGLTPMASYARCGACKQYFRVAGNVTEPIDVHHVAPYPEFAVPVQHSTMPRMCTACGASGYSRATVSFTAGHDRIPLEVPYCEKHMAQYGATKVANPIGGANEGVRVNFVDMNPPESAFADARQQELCLIVRSYAYYCVATGLAVLPTSPAIE